MSRHLCAGHHLYEPQLIQLGAYRADSVNGTGRKFCARLHRGCCASSVPRVGELRAFSLLSECQGNGNAVWLSAVRRADIKIAYSSLASCLMLAALLGCNAKAKAGLDSASQPHARASAAASTDRSVSLSNAAVGSWSEYESHQEGGLAVIRFALVARRDGDAVVEYAVRAAGITTGDVTMRATFAPGDELSRPPKSLVAQVGNFPPMERRVTPDTMLTIFPDLGSDEQLGGFEQVVVPAGAFQTTHFVHRGADGSRRGYWLSASAPPVGVARMREGSADGQEATTELARTGSGASPRIQQAPVANDDEAFAREMVEDMREKSPATPQSIH